MADFPTINMGLTVTIDGGDDVRRFPVYMGKKLARAELLPILQQHMQPVAQVERGLLADHVQSGALIASLKERSGSGDRPNVISVFSAPTATRRTLIKKWGAGRRQQRGWAWRIEPGRGRKSVFYAPMVELGHNIVRGGKVVGFAKPVGFVKGSIPALEAQAELAARAIEKQIAGE